MSHGTAVLSGFGKPQGPPAAENAASPLPRGTEPQRPLLKGAAL